MACGFVGVTLLARAVVASTADFKGTGQLGLGVVRTEMFRAGDPRGASHLHPQPLASGNVYSHNRMSQTTFWSPRKLGITNVKYVSAGVYHTIFVKTDNTVWAAGYNALGPLGLNVSAAHEPTRVLGNNPASAAGTTPLFASEAQAGYYHTLLRSAGASGADNIWSVGYNDQGQLGRAPLGAAATAGTTGTGAGAADAYAYADVDAEMEEMVEPRVTRVPGIGGVHSFAGGGLHSVVVTKDAAAPFATTVRAFGSNAAGQLGHRNGYQPVLNGGSADPAAEPSAVKRIFAVSNPNFARRYPVTQAGSRLGTQRGAALLAPSGVKLVRAGFAHTVLLMDDGTVYTCGSGNAGQLGHGDFSNRDVCTKVMDGTTGVADGAGPGFENAGVADVAAGYEHTVVVKADGSAWATGAGSYGQLGLGDAVPRQWLTPIPAPAAGVKFKRAWAGQYHSALLSTTDELYTFGFNDYGQLGHGHDQDLFSPTKVTGAWTGTVQDASLGYRHTMVVVDNGGTRETWAFGDGSATYEHVQQ